MFCVAKLPVEDGAKAGIVICVLGLELLEGVFFGSHICKHKVVNVLALCAAVFWIASIISSFLLAFDLMA